MDKTKILDNLDLLIEMSGSKNNAGNLILELNEIEKNIHKTKEVLIDMDLSLNADAYFDNNSFALDTGREASYYNDIKALEESLKEAVLKEKNAVEDEKSIYQKIKNKENELNNIGSYIEELNKKIQYFKKNKKEELQKKYQEELDQQKQIKKDLIAELNSLETEQEFLVKVLESSSTEATTLRTDIELLKKQREKLNEKLSDKSNYINSKLKKIDSNQRIELQHTVSALEARKKEIKNDPIMIGAELKKLVVLNEKESKIMPKLEALLTKVEEVPYMDLDVKNSSKAELEVELAKLIKEKEDLEEKISSYDPSSLANNIDNKRISNLEIRIIHLNKELEYLNGKVAFIDEDKEYESSIRIQEIIECKKETQKDHVDYKLKSETEKDIANQVNMNMEIDWQKQDLQEYEFLISKYTMERALDVEESNRILFEDIPKIETYIEMFNQEIIEIKERIKTRKQRKKNKVILTNDEILLEEIKLKIKAVNTRMKYDRTPASIFTEIKDGLILLAAEREKEKRQAMGVVKITDSHPRKTQPINIEMEVLETDLDEKGGIKK